MNKIITIILTLCVSFAANAKKKDAKFGYLFFESEKNWVAEDSLIRSSASIVSNDDTYTDPVLDSIVVILV